MATSWSVVKTAAPTTGPQKVAAPPSRVINTGSDDFTQLTRKGATARLNGAKRAPARLAKTPAITKAASPYRLTWMAMNWVRTTLVRLAWSVLPNGERMIRQRSQSETPTTTRVK